MQMGQFLEQLVQQYGGGLTDDMGMPGGMMPPGGGGYPQMGDAGGERDCSIM